MLKPKTVHLPSECEDLHFNHDSFKDGGPIISRNSHFIFAIRQNQRQKKCTNLYIQ